MKYDRFVYIILRDGKIKAVLTSRMAALDALKEMRDNYKWHMEKWAVCKTMST